MRILLVTGKGGVGKTTVAAATALRAADLGHRTLVMSTDPAHSLADAFDVPLGDEPSLVSGNLLAQQIDSQTRLEQYWGAVRDYLVDLFDWTGIRSVEAEELSVFPGMDELFALAEVKDHASSGQLDLLVIDCAPTAETLRLLSLPEILGWYMDKIFPVERKVVKAMRPVLTKVVSMPIAGEQVFDAAEGFYARIQGVRDILTNPLVTSARLVLNPEKMVISEARRTYTYLGLFGYAVDGVVVNRIIPDTVTDPYFKRWQEVQAEHMEEVERGFVDVDVRRLRLFDEEMVGIHKLRLLAEELYRDVDPTERLADTRPFDLIEEGDDVVLAMAIPFTDKGDVDVMRHGEELIVSVGPYRRAFILPDSLRRRQVLGAKLFDAVLRVSFGKAR
jgi:arsenite-transporting ATPase